jgi:hypothetical protein
MIMGERWDKIKIWLGKLGATLLPEKVKAYLRARASDKFEILMRGFGGMVTVWTIAIFGAIIAWVTSGDPQWSYAVAVGLGATSDYLVSV